MWAFVLSPELVCRSSELCVKVLSETVWVKSLMGCLIFLCVLFKRN